MKHKAVALLIAATIFAAVALVVILERSIKTEPEQTNAETTAELTPKSVVITLPSATDTVIPDNPIMFDTFCESVKLQEEYNLYGEQAILNRADAPVFSGSTDYTGINTVLYDFCKRAVSISDSDRIVAEEKYNRAERQNSDFSCEIRTTYFEWYEYGGVISVTFTTTVSGETYDDISCVSFAFDLTSGKKEFIIK